MRVLIVDDIEMARSEMETIITMLGHQVVHMAENGKDGVEAYKKYSPDLVTMDMNMPEMNGINALSSIIDKDPNAKILMATSSGLDNLVVKAIKAGALGYILKPLTVGAVEEAIKKIFNGNDEYDVEDLFKDM